MPGLYLGTQLSREPPRLDKDVFPVDLCQFVEYVAQVRPEKRPSMEQILDHPYIRGSADQYPTSILSELVQIFTQWSYTGGQRTSLFMDSGAVAPVNYDEVAKAEEWRFSTFLDPLEHFNQDDESSLGNTARQNIPSLQVESPDGSGPPAASFGGRRPYSPSVQARDNYDASLESNSDPASQDTIGRHSPANEDNQSSNSKATVVDDPHTEERVQRGANALANIFGGEQEYHYGGRGGQSGSDQPFLTRAKSDLPLRNISDLSDVNHKEVYTKPGEERAPATGIALADANTIKQRQRQPKRDTMAWEPEYITTPSNPMDWEPDYNSATEDDRTPALSTDFTRPSLPHSVTAPMHINTSRASTASVLDMDALLGEDFQPSTSLNSFATQPDFTEPATPSDYIPIAPARSRISTVGGHDLDMYNVTSDTSDEEEIRAERSRHTNNSSISSSIEHVNIHDSSRGHAEDVGESPIDSFQDIAEFPQEFEDHRVRTVPHDLGLEQFDTSLHSIIQPPSARVMSGQASEEEVAGELTRMMGSMLAELKAFGEEIHDTQAGNEGYDGDDDSDTLTGSTLVNGLGIGGT